MNGTSPNVVKKSTDGFLHRTVQQLFSLEGRTIVITGGGRGIGLAFAFAIAEVGGNVAILDVSDEPHPHFDLLKERFPEQQFKVYKTDVTVYEVLRQTVDNVVSDYGRIDGLVTAAGICPDEPFLERDPESVARTFSVNVLGTYYAAQLCAAQMKKQEPTSFNKGGGNIVMIASIAAHVASKGQNTSDYCSSKGAVVSLAKALGVELCPYNIRVNSISPGYVETDMTLELCNRMPHLGHIMNTEPPMRRMADRVDLKGLAVYLLSDASAYQTSEDTLVTGGIHAGRLM